MDGKAPEEGDKRSDEEGSMLAKGLCVLVPLEAVQSCLDETFAFI
jgi:hypothetical protein